MASPPLEPSVDAIFQECPRFRVLTVGKSGAGKTTLIKRTFNIDNIQGSDQDPGKCSIRDPLYSSENDRFVLHDSQGFEPGETDNFDKVKTFLEGRAKEPEIKDRLHAVWLCIQIPRAGGRLIERGDEGLFTFDFGEVPVVIVFTQYDLLYDYIYYKLGAAVLNSLTPHQREERVEQEADKYFNRECVDKLKTLQWGSSSRKVKWVKVSTVTEPRDYRNTLQELTKTTLDLVRNHVTEAAWVASATAQRVSADANVKISITVGMKRYWRGLASGTNFSGNPLSACFDVIHRDIVDVWNIRDPDLILQSNGFKARVLEAIQDLADPNPNHSSGFTANLETIKAALDVVTPISGPAAPVVASIGLSVMFGKWLFGLYNNTPGTLRSLMGYIVDLTIVLEGIFWLKVAQPRNPTLSEDDVAAAFDMFNRADEQIQVHREIRGYVDGMALIDHAHPDNTHIEVERLVKAHRPDFINGSKSEQAKERRNVVEPAGSREETRPRTEALSHRTEEGTPKDKKGKWNPFSRWKKSGGER